MELELGVRDFKKTAFLSPFPGALPSHGAPVASFLLTPPLPALLLAASTHSRLIIIPQSLSIQKTVQGNNSLFEIHFPSD